MADTLVQLSDVARRLPEADRVRLLRFAEAMLQQRRGKRQQRAKRTQTDVVGSWQVGQ
jgi:hypothetical protein